MKRLLGDWEIDKLLDGEGTAEMARVLASSPADQHRLEEIRAENNSMRATLFRVECPPVLTLGEWFAGLAPAEVAQTVERHIADCPHCAAEVAQIKVAMSAPVTPEREPLLRRIVLKLERILDAPAGSGAPAVVALRGDSWSGVFANGDYMISLTRRRTLGGYSLQGSLITPENAVKGQAQLLQASGAIADTTLSAAATFTFDQIPSGQYELIVRTTASELIVPELQLQD